jgi:hypothetical protein
MRETCAGKRSSGSPVIVFRHSSPIGAWQSGHKIVSASVWMRDPVQLGIGHPELFGVVFDAPSERSEIAGERFVLTAAGLLAAFLARDT